ncbi:MAG TPA: tyrosine/phenylalanine carboxypeptidase domain-containing protein, partial [Candidatus Saccharimonadales bacterium]|nr:tyrosine/phenylalanine carboxypeptidase domain-containing protein [Candidatus Saccharimonadales bacterium]
MSSEIPSVLVLEPITPSNDSVRAEELKYPKLQPAVEKHGPYEHARMNRFWDAEGDSLEELEAARQLAMQYMLMGSLALTQTTNQDVWSKRYTQATSELYGLPEPDLARSLWSEQLSERGDVEVPFKEAAQKVGEYLNDKYAAVFDALDIDSSSPESIDPNGVADRFEAALAVLADQYDPDWSNWKIERNSEKDSLSVVAETQTIIVGMKRASVQPQQLEALFSHEILVHGLRAVNGRKISESLGTGLPGYLDAEEGLGVFIEYAISGNISEKNIDRYVDIAYALGQIDGEEHSRQELIDYAMKRAIARNDKAEHKKTIKDIEKEVYAHVNRIYRGSLGNESIGIFTKDISYHKGFVEMGRYIQAQIDNGKSIEEVLDFLLTG